MGRVRLFAHPGNPDAKAAAAVQAARTAAIKKSEQRQPLTAGSVVPAGTVLGTVSTAQGASSGSIRFAVRPAGDPGSIDPAPILANWAQLQTALHPKGARATDPLLGATASDVFLLSKTELQRAVLSDPGITLGACERREVASGAADARVLALLAFLSRSGLQPTVKAIGCTTGHSALAGQQDGDFVDISAIDGKPVSGHQGPGTITDLTIRTLLTLPAKFVPNSIISPCATGSARDARAIRVLEPNPRDVRSRDHAGEAEHRRGLHGRSLRGQGRRRSLSRREHECAQHRRVEPAHGPHRVDPGSRHRHEAELRGDPGPEATLT